MYETWTVNYMTSNISVWLKKVSLYIVYQCLAASSYTYYMTFVPFVLNYCTPNKQCLGVGYIGVTLSVCPSIHLS